MIDTDEVPLLLKLAGEKECEYQAAEGRDLYCLAPSANDETARWVVNGRSAAPTSKPICGACSLPDTGYLCSNFSHAEVLGFPRTQDSGIERQLIGGSARQDAPRSTRSPGNAARLGHGCWERHIDLSSVPAVAVNAQSVTCTGVRLRFGESARSQIGTVLLDQRERSRYWGPCLIGD